MSATLSDEDARLGDLHRRLVEHVEKTYPGKGYHPLSHSAGLTEGDEAWINMLHEYHDTKLVLAGIFRRLPTGEVRRA